MPLPGYDLLHATKSQFESMVMSNHWCRAWFDCNFCTYVWMIVGTIDDSSSSQPLCVTDTSHVPPKEVTGFYETVNVFFDQNSKSTCTFHIAL